MNEAIRSEDRETVQAFVDVLFATVDAESDGDHVQSLLIDYADLSKWYGEVIRPNPNPELTEETVEGALAFAEEHLSPTVQTAISIHVGSELPDITDESLLRY